MKKSICQQAHEIVNERSEEKTREYGPFDESMGKAARIASELCNKEITTEDFYKCMIALKMSRMAYNLKEDTLLDAVAYIQALDNFTPSKSKDEMTEELEEFLEENLCSKGVPNNHLEQCSTWFANRRSCVGCKFYRDK